MTRPELAGGLTFHNIEYVSELPPSSSTSQCSTGGRQKASPSLLVDLNDELHSNIATNLQGCQPAMMAILELERALGDDAKVLFNLEEALLEMASYPACTEGVFYVIVYDIGQTILCRYIESGCYYGFFEACAREAISTYCGISSDQVVGIKVYTQEDITERGNFQTSKEYGRKQKKGDKRSRADKRYQACLFENKSKAVKPSMTILQEGRRHTSIKMLGSLVHTAQHSFQHILNQPAKGIPSW